MLEGQSYLISRALPGSCEQESKWAYMTYRLIEISNGKRPLEDEREEPHEQREASNPALEQQRGEREMIRHLHNLSQPSELQSHKRHRGINQSDSDTSGDCCIDLNRFPEEQSDSQEMVINCYPSELPEDHSEHGHQSELDSLIQQLGRDLSINCLLLCSRSDYDTLACLNRSFRWLIRNGELYRLRRQKQIVEHWVYFSCQLLEWEAFDPNRRRWMHLPRMPANECFMCADKESLAVGTELLVFGKEITSQVIYRYSILTNSWSSGLKMNSPRCLFGSASLGEIAIVAGGSDTRGNSMNSAELYNSVTGTWKVLPSMNKPRKMCSGVFMDGKFYVIGGSNPEPLTCGEEYDLQTGVWREIPNMSPMQNRPNGTTAPPLVAVVNNELYAADYAENELRKYSKDHNSWTTLGWLPERAASVNGWGLAFRACGNQLIVIGGPRNMGGGIVELNSWFPDEGPPEWRLLASKHLASFVYNCAVMGC